MKLLAALTVAGLFAVSPALAEGGCQDKKNFTSAKTTQLPPAPTTGS